MVDPYEECFVPKPAVALSNGLRLARVRIDEVTPPHERVLSRSTIEQAQPESLECFDAVRNVMAPDVVNMLSSAPQAYIQSAAHFMP
jgi:hypothetical protein